MPVLDSSSLEYISRSAEATQRVGMRLGSQLQPGDVICLVGELGSGKTTLVKGLTVGWGSTNEVTSPSFVLINVYRRPDGQQLYHLDAYRLDTHVEAQDLDLDGILESGPLVVEWSDRIQLALPEQHLRIHLQWVDVQQRDMIITARGERYQEFVQLLRRQVYGVS